MSHSKNFGWTSIDTTQITILQNIENNACIVLEATVEIS